MILKANQDEVTGWGEGGGKEIPKYHNQFPRFRGYAFFDSDDPSSLPWNTTKTGVNEDSSGYRAVRLEMIGMMRPIFDFLNELDKEKEKEETEGKQLETAVDAAKPARLVDIQRREVFLPPEKKAVHGKPQPRLQRIQYDKPLTEVERVKG